MQEVGDTGLGRSGRDALDLYLRPHALNSVIGIETNEDPAIDGVSAEIPSVESYAFNKIGDELKPLFS